MNSPLNFRLHEDILISPTKIIVFDKALRILDKIGCLSMFAHQGKITMTLFLVRKHQKDTVCMLFVYTFDYDWSFRGYN
jgi:hypothetical protein